jgi:hypothetical protein
MPRSTSAPKMVTYRFVRIATAPPEKLFDLVANADQWKHWAGPLALTSYFSDLGPAQDGALGAVRALGPGPAVARERTTIHERPHRYGYEMAKEMPLLRGYKSVLEFREHPAGTVVTWSGSFQESFPGSGLVMGAAIRRLMKNFLRRLVEHADKH